MEPQEKVMMELVKLTAAASKLSLRSDHYPLKPWELELVKTLATAIDDPQNYHEGLIKTCSEMVGYYAKTKQYLHVKSAAIVVHKMLLGTTVNQEGRLIKK